MKKILLILLLSISLNQVQAQRYLHLSAGYSDIRPDEWNKTISAYNFARPWLKNELPALRSAMTYGIGYSGVIGKGLFLTPDISYSRYVSAVVNEPANTTVDIRWFRGQMYLDVYPREFKLDSVGHVVRPFFRLGGGASSLLPRVTINDSLTTVDDEPYTPVVWSHQFSAGIGCRFNVAKHIDIVPVIMYHYQPGILLEDFSYALHGTQLPGLIDKQKMGNIQFMLTFSVRLGREDDRSE
jgi:hypothetical protein